MGFVKGNDGIASTLRNTLEGSVGNIALENIAATGNVTGNWLFATSGNIGVPDGVTTLRLGNNTPNTIWIGVGNAGNIYIGSVASTTQATGNLTAGGFISATGNIISAANVAGGNVSVTGNVTGGNVLTAGIVSATGNVTAANFFGNGNTLSNVATQVTGSWTVPVGNNTQSFTVPINNTYQLWVLGNIPNGIIVYNATVSVSNTNVPVIGQQFAWNYEGGGNILMFTSIPAQIVGTAGTISNAAPAVANTNVFTFGINNTSGNTVTVNYGYTKIS